MSKSRSPQICEACRGKAIVPKVVLSDQAEHVHYLGRRLPVLGYVIDQPCHFCKGRGVVDAQRLTGDNRFIPPEPPSL